MKNLSLVILLTISVLSTCARVQQPTRDVAADVQGSGYHTYVRIKAALETSDETIDYDTLMQVYTSMVQAEDQIPHMDQLLYTLIDKRNRNPRVDQMILIFSARAIEKSRFEIPHVYEIFEAILKEDNDRVNEWVISFVASSVGRYPFDMPNGDGLVDFLEQRLDQIVASTPSDSKEFYGFHFLPPPQSDYIISYLEGIEKRRVRELERAHYYALIQSNITENKIEAALRCIRENGMPETGNPCPQPLKYLLVNTDSLFPGIDKKAGRREEYHHAEDSSP